jgi:DNA-binding IclR family transcriptional regulator
MPKSLSCPGGAHCSGPRQHVLRRRLKLGRPCQPAELAQRTGTNERYVREWLGNQAAGGYVEYDAKSRAYFLNEDSEITY